MRGTCTNRTIAQTRLMTEFHVKYVFYGLDSYKSFFLQMHSLLHNEIKYLIHKTLTNDIKSVPVLISKTHVHSIFYYDFELLGTVPLT